MVGVSRPSNATTGEGVTPALSAAQARALLDAPDPDTPKGKRDRAILATLLYHGIRREELVKLRVKGIHDREGVPHLSSGRPPVKLCRSSRCSPLDKLCRRRRLNWDTGIVSHCVGHCVYNLLSARVVDGGSVSKLVSEPSRFV